MYKTALRNVTVRQLTDAVNALAKELGATVITRIRDYYDNNVKIDIGLQMRGLPHGIGCRVVNGELRIVGDLYMQATEFARMQQLIPNFVKMHQVQQKAAAQRMRTKTSIKGSVVELEICYER